jgi:hypothetical protein
MPAEIRTKARQRTRLTAPTPSLAPQPRVRWLGQASADDLAARGPRRVPDPLGVGSRRRRQHRRESEASLVRRPPPVRSSACRRPVTSAPAVAPAIRVSASPGTVTGFARSATRGQRQPRHTPLSSSKRLRASSVESCVVPLIVPPGRARLAAKATLTGSANPGLRRLKSVYIGKLARSRVGWRRRATRQKTCCLLPASGTPSLLAKAAL